jgi:hypothetical protein
MDASGSSAIGCDAAHVTAGRSPTSAGGAAAGAAGVLSALAAAAGADEPLPGDFTPRVVAGVAAHATTSKTRSRTRMRFKARESNSPAPRLLAAPCRYIRFVGLSEINGKV